MNRQTLEQQLRSEGYIRVFVWRDAPGAVYPDHTHASDTTHVVLEGEITVTTADGSRTCKRGDRFDVPAGALHSARVGAQGCTYLIGEK